MPQILSHIDAIARREGRGVLFVTFGIDTLNMSFPVEIPDWREMPIRKQVIEWLDVNNYSWEACAEIASENFMVAYLGTIYIKVPYDDQNPEYQKLQNYLETPTGTMRFDKVIFNYLPLTIAMKNAHHDAPGFWEKWAETF
jgi:hypothetical protein